MSNQIIKQPDGKYAMFSTNTDTIFGTDFTRAEIIEWMVEQERERILEKVNDICDQLDSGKKPYFQFTMTWDDANQQSLRDRKGVL